MSDFFQLIFNSDPMGNVYGGTEETILAALMAVFLGHVIACAYMWTHEGVSYSKNFTVSLVIMPVLISLIMRLMSTNIAIAFGLLAVFSMIRFRNVLKDTRDTAFILWAVVIGMAIGTTHYSKAMIGCFFIAGLFLYLSTSGFGNRHRYDGVLALRLTGDLVTGLATLKRILRRHAVHVRLATERNLSDEGLDLSYRLLMRDPKRSGDLIAELEASDGIEQVSLFHRESESEI